jgi:hypothetical protein
MTDIAASTEAYHGRGAPHLDNKSSPTTVIVFFCLLAAGIGYGIHGLLDDIQSVHELLALGVFLLLGLALLIALGFEFVNGFHDTANAVATVIYTRRMFRWPILPQTGSRPCIAVTIGGYFILDQLLWRKNGTSDSGLGGFLRADGNPGDRNLIELRWRADV